MVKKYIILANTSIGFKEPKQLIKINDEPLICRTIRLLKENGIEDIIISSNNKAFDGLGVERYNPKFNKWDGKNGYWLDAFPLEILNEPTTYLFGDMYYSESLIKKIVNTEVEDNTLFCCYENKNKLYIKSWDEPQAFKVVDIEKFKEHIGIVKKLKDEGKLWREPIQWELYRSMNGLDITTHKIKDNCIVTNDESCDIDFENELKLLKVRLLDKIDKKLSIIIPYYETYELTKKILEVLVPQLNKDVEVILVDDGCNEERLDDFKDKIKIIHLKENKGGAYACNVGIFESKGQYIGVIDSDDMISNDYIETLLNAIDSHDEDVIFMDWQDMNTGEITHHPNNYAPWKAIYNRKVIPLFPEGTIYSYDVKFYNDLNEKPYTKYYIDKVLYFYNSNREGNLTTRKERIRKENMIKCEAIRDFTLERFNDLEDVKRKRIDIKGKIFAGDTFKCDKDLADYLMGKNDKGVIAVKILEIQPENKNVEKEEEHIEKTKTKKSVKKNEKKNK